MIYPQVDYNLIEQLKDGFFVSEKYDSRPVFMDRPMVLIFANMPPDKSKMTADRWWVQQTAQLIADANMEDLRDDLSVDFYDGDSM